VQIQDATERIRKEARLLDPLRGGGLPLLGS
jgi:hypothetical protein